MRLVVAGGGTGGHLFPGIAVAEEFIAWESGNEVLFVGTEKGIEARVLPRLGFRLECIAAAGIRGKGFKPRPLTTDRSHRDAEPRKLKK